MRTLAVTSQSDWTDFHFFDGSPWLEFKKEMNSQGFEIVLLDENPEFVVVLNHKRWPKCFKNRLVKKHVLVVFEPEVVSPINYAKKIRSKYSYVYLPSPMWKVSDNERIFNWPQTSILSVGNSISRVNRQNRFVMILGNHFSVAKSELYSLRREIAVQKKVLLDVYGPNWSTSIFVNYLRTFNSLKRFFAAGNFSLKTPSKIWFRREMINYCGVTENKFETYQNYRFALVIENSPDYVSEKLIDAIIAGTIPVYVGPRLFDFGFPSNIALEVEGNCNAIVKGMNLLVDSVELQETIHQEGQKFLKSSQYLEIVNQNALGSLAKLIATDLLDGAPRED